MKKKNAIHQAPTVAVKHESDTAKDTFYFEKIPGNDLIVKAKTTRGGRVYEIDVMAIPEDIMERFEQKVLE